MGNFQGNRGVGFANFGPQQTVARGGFSYIQHRRGGRFVFGIGRARNPSLKP